MNTQKYFELSGERGNDMSLARMYLAHSILGLRLLGGSFSEQSGKLMDFFNNHHFDHTGKTSVLVLKTYFGDIGLPDYFSSIIAAVIKRLRKYPDYENPYELSEINTLFTVEAMLAVVLAEQRITLDLYQIGINLPSIKSNYDELIFSEELLNYNSELLEKYINIDLNIYGINKQNVLVSIAKILRLTGFKDIEDLESEEIKYILEVIVVNVTQAVKMLYSVTEWEINNIE